MTLIEKLETGPGSRELSDECLLAVGWQRVGKAGVHWYDPDGFRFYGTRPNPSQNLQDAVTWMVPEGWDWEMEWESGADGMYWENGTARVKMGNPDLLIDPEAASPALALCIAALKTRAETD